MVKVGFIGLGKMGLNMALNVTDKGWSVVGFDANESAREKAKAKGLTVADTEDVLLSQLDEPKVVLLSTPAGPTTNGLVKELTDKLHAGDIIIDSGNSYYKDSQENFRVATEKEIHFVDCGTSGGMSGARYGACLMVGGEEAVVKQLEGFFTDLAIEDGYLYAGKPGSGHYLKMVHNGIEYGMMEAIGEGFAVLEESDYDFEMADVAKCWANGSVIRSWLIDLMVDAFKQDPNLDDIEGIIDANGEAKWTVQEALDLDIPLPVIASSLYVRNASKIENSFSNRVVASLRNGFGGHALYKKGE
ncbi:MAG: decarboxylating 6-phosphogluconate dehydrogenase [Aerococcus sp.]|nr:decarboxylating 6-phosphogluconate dehydrogenase [Aerococcus sp.]